MGDPQELSYGGILHINDVSNVGSTLVKGLVSAGFRARLFQPTLGTYRASWLQRAVLPIKRIADSMNLRKIISEENYRLLHVHYGYFGVMAKLASSPYILHLHGGDIHNDLRHPIRSYLTRGAIRDAEGILFSTPDLADPIRRIRSDSQFLPNPVDTSLFSPRRHDLNRERLKILFISKLDSRKGIGLLISVIKKIRAKLYSTVLHAFNFGDVAQDYLARLRDLDVTLLSPLDHMKMPDLINSMDIIIGQMNEEIGSMGVSELEALACGKPVIMDFRHDWAYGTLPPVFRARDGDMVVEAIQFLSNDPMEYIKASEDSREWLIRNHDKDVIVNRTIRFYMEVMNRKL